VTQTASGEARLYRVRVGPHASRDEAAETQRQLEGKGYSSPWIADSTGR
jgi:cell division protein FtsN